MELHTALRERLGTEASPSAAVCDSQSLKGGKDPRSGLALWFHERVGAAKGRIRRIMIVAMARKLVVALGRYLTEGVVPEGAARKA